MTKYKLREIIELNPRESIKKGNIARKIAMDDLGEFKRDIESYSYSEYKGGTKFRNYDTLMARITPCLENGKTSFVNILEENEVAFGSTEYFVFRAKQDIINPYYLYYLVTTDKFREVAIKSMSGTSGRQRVQKDQILDFSVNLPSLEDQEKIMKPLKLIDDKISLNTKLNTNLLAIAKEKYQKMLASSLLTKTKLKDFATITMGQSPSSKTYNKEKQGVALLNGATDFRNGIHPSKWTTDPKKVVNKGAYIFGVRATIGLTTKVFNKYAIGRGTGSAVSKDTTNDEFLYFVLNDMFKDFKNTGSGSVYINISKKDLNEYTFYKPKINELISFHQTIAPIMNKIYTNNQENIVLTEIKENLLKQFF